MAHDPTAPPPPEVSHRPSLTPSFCFNTTALRDFLRLSRATTDDSLSLHLNSLLTPSRNSFSTASQPTYGRSRQQVPATVCTKFKNDTLFPSWRDRETVLSYCGEVAANPQSDPDPAEMERRQVIMRMPSDKLAQARVPGTQDPQAESFALELASDRRTSRNYFNEPQIVDERVDPYSGRDYSWNREPRSEILHNVLESERGVERIVRARTWNLLGERCLRQGQDISTTRDGGWEGDWQQWQLEQRP